MTNIVIYAKALTDVMQLVDVNVAELLSIYTIVKVWTIRLDDDKLGTVPPEYNGVI
jgi:hypothetical protein